MKVTHSHRMQMKRTHRTKEFKMQTSQLANTDANIFGLPVAKPLDFGLLRNNTAMVGHGQQQ